MKFINKKTVLLSVVLLVLVSAVYFLPRMINQLSYPKYLVHVPEKMPASGKYPLLLYLHGSGIRGNDLSKLEDSGPRPFLMNNDYPFVLVSPLCKEHDSWHSKYLLDLLDSIETKLPIDRDRVYVTGLSMGGTGAWHLAQDAPGRFAAIAPICGRSDYDLALLMRMKDVPVWAFHGKLDDIIPYEESERLVNKLKEEGADVKFTLYPDLGHDCYDAAYKDPELYAWLLTKSRTGSE